MYYGSFDIGEGYTEAVDNVIIHQVDSNTVFTLHPFSLKEKAAKTKEDFEGIISTRGYSETMSQKPVWVNNSFYLYMGGTY
jgi:hypothetical protein